MKWKKSGKKSQHSLTVPWLFAPRKKSRYASPGFPFFFLGNRVVLLKNAKYGFIYWFTHNRKLEYVFIILRRYTSCPVYPLECNIYNFEKNPSSAAYFWKLWN